jgi:hypothetical protein
MIWLVKTREKTITDGKKGKYAYLKDCMEPADKYIKKIKPTKICWLFCIFIFILHKIHRTVKNEEKKNINVGVFINMFAIYN